MDIFFQEEQYLLGFQIQINKKNQQIANNLELLKSMIIENIDHYSISLTIDSVSNLKYIEEIFKILQDVTSLTLTLSNFHIIDKHIIETLFKLIPWNSIIVLNLINNIFNQEYTKLLSEILNSNNTIESLTIIFSDNIRDLFNGFRNNFTLKKLEFSYCNLCDEEALLLINLLKNYKSITNVKIDSAKIKTKRLAQKIKKLAIKNSLTN